MHRFQLQERQCTTFQAKKVYFDLIRKCSSLHTVKSVCNGPEAVTVYTVTGQLPKIFGSCLPQQRVAVVHWFDYVTLNKRFRYFYTFPETYTLGVRDSSCALDVGLTDPHPPISFTPEIKPLA